jgi:hypothetical protein
MGITPLVYQPKPPCATRNEGAGGIGSARKQEGRIMKTQRLLVVLTLVNLALLIFVLARTRPASAEVPPVLRGRALQIVDEQGRVRASIAVLPAKAQEHETVLLRLITERGRPSVKIGASEQAAGLSLAGPSNTKDTYVILEAKGTASSLTLKNEDGRAQILKP